jgi:hypothetical protein
MTIRNLVLGAGLAAILWSPLLKAQTTEVATVPFGFHANSITLPAGEYTVSKDTMSGIVRLRNNDTNKSVLIASPSRKSGNLEDSKLTFHCYGDHYFLAEIWIPGSPAYTFAKSNLEKEMENGGARLAMAYVPLATR